MGSSARKKKEKKKDFQKVKLKVGKTKPKADNFTDTSFKAKSIVVSQQSLTTEAPSTIAHLHHYLSLASSSRSDTQRRDALSFLSSQLSSKPVNEDFGLPTTVLLPKLAPLILDGSSSVRTQLIKFLQLLPRNDIGHLSEKVLLYVRAGMTHLAVDIQTDSLAVLEWLLEVADEDVVSCPGGWVKTLKCFMSMMGWASSKTTTTWTTAPKATFGKVGKSFPRQLLVLSQFLRAGLVESNKVVEIIPRQSNFPLTDSNAHMLPRISNPYAYLNLFGAPRDEEGEMYVDRPGRQRVFHQLFEDSVRKGIDSAVKAAGEAGRAAGVLTKVLKAGMEDFEGVDDDTL